VDVDAVHPNYRRFATKLQALDGKTRERLLTDSAPENVKFNTDLLEMFVEDYDGKHVFDRHLNLQTSRMWSHDRNVKTMNHFDIVLETANLTAELAQLANEEGARIPEEMVKRQSSQDMLNVTAVSDATFQKICRLTARDYCCLNYVMPPACRQDDVPKGKRVLCQWVPTENGGKAIKAILV
jgi:hypothetical protein